MQKHPSDSWVRGISFSCLRETRREKERFPGNKEFCLRRSITQNFIYSSGKERRSSEEKTSQLCSRRDKWTGNAITLERRMRMWELSEGKERVLCVYPAWLSTHCLCFGNGQYVNFEPGQRDNIIFPPWLFAAKITFGGKREEPSDMKISARRSSLRSALRVVHLFHSRGSLVWHRMNDFLMTYSNVCRLPLDRKSVV